MEKEIVSVLIAKYLEDRLHEKERVELVKLLEHPASTRALDELVLEALAQRTYAFEPDDSMKEAIQQYLNEHRQRQPSAVHSIDAAAPKAGNPEQTAPVQRFSIRQWVGYAAAVLIFCGITVYMWQQNYEQSQTTPVITEKRTTPTADIAPGMEGAILTLADGTQLVLDSLQEGIIAAQNGTEVLLENGKLAYNALLNTGDTTTPTLSYNTITTPKGRQFQLILPDGSKIWLNAMSSVKYPTSFSAKERQIEVTGEAYLEVAANRNQPFIVNIDDKATVEVLGTSFNINAYKNESHIRTTLIDGSIKVADKINDANKNVVLKPGQQASISNTNHTNSKIGVINVNTAKAVAWKDGSFNFDGVKLAAAMRQLSRWYDIEVVYEKGIPDIEFIGSISKKFTLKEVIKAMEMSNVHFRLEEGRRLVVLP